MGMLLMGSCISQRQLRKPFINNYVDWQVDSFYNYNADQKFRSYFLTKKFMSEVDIRNMQTVFLNRQISVLKDSITALSAYVHKGNPDFGGNSRVLYYKLGKDGFDSDKLIELDFSNDAQVPNILQFYVIFNTAENWEAIGTFSVDLNNIYDCWYGVTCPEGESGNGEADFKASYTIQYDSRLKKVIIQRAQIGRKGRDNKWHDSMKDSHYGIRSIVALY
jgi:hypothetical protein